MKHKYGAYLGIREIDSKQIKFASRMEFNYYLYLRWLKKIGGIADFEYQPIEFDFHQKIKEHPELWDKEWLPPKAKYRPDFWVKENDGQTYYVETMGKLRDDHKRNFKLMRQLFPEVKIRIVNMEMFKQTAETVAPMIPEWERGNFEGQESRFGRSWRRGIPHISEIGRIST